VILLEKGDKVGQDNSKGDVFNRLSKKRAPEDRTDIDYDLETLIKREGF